MKAQVVSDKIHLSFTNTTGPHSPRLITGSYRRQALTFPNSINIPLQGIFSEAGLLQPGPWAYHLLGNLQIHTEAASQDWSRRYWHCPQMWCVWRPNPAWKQEIMVCFWWTCHGVSLLKSLKEVLLWNSLGTSNTGNFRKWIMQIQFLINRGSTSFKRQNNYIPSAWFPAVMRLRNVRVGLTNNSLFFDSGTREGFGGESHKNCLCCCLKRFRDKPLNFSPCFPLMNN